MRTVLIVMMSLISLTVSAWSGEIDSLLRVLDGDIVKCAEYDKIKEDRIEELKGELAEAADFEQRYELNEDIYNEYMKFISDSALHYINENIILARLNKDFVRETDALLSEAHLFTCLGMYMEAKEILDGIDRGRLPESLLGDYYKCYRYIYNEASNSKPLNNITSPRYRNLGDTYRDSMMMVLPATDDDYLVELMRSAKIRGDYEEALRYNDIRMEKTALGEPLYAMVAYDRFRIYDEQGGRNEEKIRWLILSAISDLRSAIREQSSMLKLAGILYEKEDFDRANRYINYSWKVTDAYNTRKRNWSHISPYSVITTGFQNTINRQNTLLRHYLILITVLSIFLFGAFVYTYRLLKKLRVANQELSESNRIKEVYIARFFKLCTTYIDRAHSYRNMVNKKLRKGKVEELLELTSPANDTSAEEQTELFVQFDKAFLKIFPNFVDSVNALLKPEERIVLKDGELMTPELRICALMRLGFLKPAQIAELLHYSPTTVYNYRTKLREKALSRDKFESLVTQIIS